MKINTKGLLCTVLLGVCLLYSSTAFALNFTITSQLLGDPREENPDGLIVDVTIDVVDTVATWTVDINSTQHADVKLHEFYFNMDGVSTDYSFSDFIPTEWTVESPADLQGAGGVNFVFEAFDDVRPKTNVTNTRNLIFEMRKEVNGNFVEFVENDFLNASFSQLNDGLGAHQLGAHLGSLTSDPPTSDSGFAVGDYSSTPVPEPSTILLMGSGLLGIIGFSRKRLNKKA